MDNLPVIARQVSSGTGITTTIVVCATVVVVAWMLCNIARREEK
jgi:hypothetical protein